jgi:5-(hydroxymethyl)furfural/furfural oxidase
VSSTVLEADWVVVGGGSAGCVVAARLSEDPAADVVLLEAGPAWRAADAPHEIRSLNGWRALDEATCAQFQWPALESRRAAGQEPRAHLRGRGLGGSSVVNGMIAIRAMADDYDRWATGGCSGWSYDEMLPYLRRMEDDADFGELPYHGQGGPIPVVRLPRDEWGPVDHALAERALGLGYPWCDDHNAPRGTGVSPYALNARSGSRVTANDGYLEPARERPNLRVVGDALVDRVLVEGDRAVGVRVRVGETWIEVRAAGVVLCAGAVHSPAILLRSGIGLDGRVASLPVGEGLQDHPLALFWLHLRPEAQPELDARQTNCCLRYSSDLVGAPENDMMIVAVNQTLSPTDLTDAEPDAGVGTWGGAGGGRAVGGPGLLCIWANHQTSRGRLVLDSQDPDVNPVIDENMLDDAGDRLRMRDAVKRGLELLDGDPFRSVLERVTIDVAGTGVDALAGDAEIDRWLLETVGDTAHICGTCRMGDPDDEWSVVDPAGRVLGVDALWVADASVFPEVPRANTNLPTIAAAERVSDLIRDAEALSEGVGPARVPMGERR